MFVTKACVIDGKKHKFFKGNLSEVPENYSGKDLLIIERDCSKSDTISYKFYKIESNLDE